MTLDVEGSDAIHVDLTENSAVYFVPCAPDCEAVAEPRIVAFLPSMGFDEFDWASPAAGRYYVTVSPVDPALPFAARIDLAP